MSKFEKRFILSSILAGITDILFGLIFYLTGIADWYYAKFHVFGILGFGMILYGLWHFILYKLDNKGELH